MIDPTPIRDAQIFDGLTQFEIEELATIAREEHVEKGERLLSRGEKTDTFYIVKTGRFALTIGVRLLDTYKQVAVEEKVAGDAFGWSAMVDPFAAYYSAYCMLDGSVIALPSREFESLLASDMHLGLRFSRNLNQLIGSRLRALQDLWIAEVEQHRARVEHWTHTRLSGDLNSTLEATHVRAHRRFFWTHH